MAFHNTMGTISSDMFKSNRSSKSGRVAKSAYSAQANPELVDKHEGVKAKRKKIEAQIHEAEGNSKGMKLFYKVFGSAQKKALIASLKQEHSEVEAEMHAIYKEINADKQRQTEEHFAQEAQEKEQEQELQLQAQEPTFEDNELSNLDILHEAFDVKEEIKAETKIDYENISINHSENLADKMAKGVEVEAKKGFFARMKEGLQAKVQQFKGRFAKTERIEPILAPEDAVTAAQPTTLENEMPEEQTRIAELQTIIQNGEPANDLDAALDEMAAEMTKPQTSEMVAETIAELEEISSVLASDEQSKEAPALDVATAVKVEELEPVRRLKKIEEQVQALKISYLEKRVTFNTKLKENFVDPSKVKVALRAARDGDEDAYISNTRIPANAQARTELTGDFLAEKIKTEIEEKAPNLNQEYADIILASKLEKQGIDAAFLKAHEGQCNGKDYFAAGKHLEQMVQEPETFGGGLKEGAVKADLGTSIVEQMAEMSAIRDQIKKLEAERVAILKPIPTLTDTDIDIDKVRQEQLEEAAKVAQAATMEEEALPQPIVEYIEPPILAEIVDEKVIQGHFNEAQHSQVERDSVEEEIASLINKDKDGDVVTLEALEEESNQKKPLSSFQKSWAEARRTAKAPAATSSLEDTRTQTR